MREKFQMSINFVDVEHLRSCEFMWQLMPRGERFKIEKKVERKKNLG